MFNFLSRLATSSTRVLPARLVRVGTLLAKLLPLLLMGVVGFGVWLGIHVLVWSATFGLFGFAVPWTGFILATALCAVGALIIEASGPDDPIRYY